MNVDVWDIWGFYYSPGLSPLVRTTEDISFPAMFIVLNSKITLQCALHQSQRRHRDTSSRPPRRHLVKVLLEGASLGLLQHGLSSPCPCWVLSSSPRQSSATCPSGVSPQPSWLLSSTNPLTSPFLLRLPRHKNSLCPGPSPSLGLRSQTPGLGEPALLHRSAGSDL